MSGAGFPAVVLTRPSPSDSLEEHAGLPDGLWARHRAVSFSDHHPIRSTGRRLGDLLQLPPGGRHHPSGPTGGTFGREVQVMHPVPRRCEITHARQLG